MKKKMMIIIIAAALVLLGAAAIAVYNLVICSREHRRLDRRVEAVHRYVQRLNQVLTNSTHFQNVEASEDKENLVLTGHVESEAVVDELYDLVVTSNPPGSVQAELTVGSSIKKDDFPRPVWFIPFEDRTTE